MADLQITIDDGPEPAASALTSILAELKKRGVKAAFFVLGRPDAAKAIHADGHVLGNHSWNYLEPSASTHSNAQIIALFRRTHDEVKAATHVTMKHWRAPRLDSRKRLQRILTSGSSQLYTLSHCDWDADSLDAHGSTTAAQMLANIRAGIASRPDSKFYRLLFHVAPHTAKALPEILTELTVKDHHKLVDFTQTTTVLHVPAALDVQRIAGMIYAESAAVNSGGENADEKAGIGATIVNRAHHARCNATLGGGACYNSGFGNGTILDALKHGFAAYGQARWNEIMINDIMRPPAELNALPQSKRDHLDLSIVAAEALDLASTPLSQIAVGGAPVAFNQASDSPPSPRMKRIGSAGKHTFYAFKPGRECG